MPEHLENKFARLRSARYQVTSEETTSYNCVSWAARDTTRWWWPFEPPFSYWPLEVPRDDTPQSFIKAFETLGYKPCEDGRLEQRFEKVAIFVDSSNTTTHIARQLPNGHWTSKLADLEDIEHETLEQLEGAEPAYGKAVQFLKKRIPAAS